MKVFYINLDHQLKRRENVEKNFKKYNANGWALTRVDAISKDNLPNNQLAKVDQVTINNWACNQSHFKAIRIASEQNDDALIAEDDICFGPDTQQLVESAIAQLPRGDWDILYTDVIIPEIYSMIDLFELRKRFPQSIRLIDLEGMQFAGATSYIINSTKRWNLVKLTNNLSSLDLPFDLYLRNLINQKVLKAFVIFPFATSLSEYAEATQIQHESTINTDILWNSFRRLVWYNRDLEKVTNGLSQISINYFDDEEAALMSRISQGMLCKQFVRK